MDENIEINDNELDEVAGGNVLDDLYGVVTDLLGDNITASQKDELYKSIQDAGNK